MNKPFNQEKDTFHRHLCKSQQVIPMFPEWCERPGEDETNASYFITAKERNRAEDEGDTEWYGSGLPVAQ